MAETLEKTLGSYLLEDLIFDHVPTFEAVQVNGEPPVKGLPDELLRRPLVEVESLIVWTDRVVLAWVGGISDGPAGVLPRHPSIGGQNG